MRTLCLGGIKRVVSFEAAAAGKSERPRFINVIFLTNSRSKLRTYAGNELCSRLTRTKRLQAAHTIE